MGNNIMRLAAALFIMMLLPAPALADSIAAAKILSGEEIVLSDGRTLRLTGIAVPDAKDASEKLQALTQNKTLQLDDPSADRYGRVTAQAYALDDKNNRVWLQGELLGAGLAFVYPPAGSEARLENMLKLEHAARIAHLGIWAGDAFADLPPEERAGILGNSHSCPASCNLPRARRTKSISISAARTGAPSR